MGPLIPSAIGKNKAIELAQIVPVARDSAKSEQLRI